MKTLRHEEVYRGEKLLQKMAVQPFIICGAGAIGSNLVDNMVRQGFGDITVIDFDRIEDHNRHTQIWTKRDLGQMKTTILKNAMYSVRDVVIKDKGVKLEEGNVSKLLTPGALVVDGFDNIPSRALVTKHCKGKKIECLHVGLYKDYAEVAWNDVYRVPSDVKGMDVCEYPLARNIIMMAVTVATDVIIRYLSNGARESYDITLGDFKIIRR